MKLKKLIASVTAAGIAMSSVISTAVFDAGALTPSTVYKNGGYEIHEIIASDLSGRYEFDTVVTGSSSPTLISGASFNSLYQLYDNGDGRDGTIIFNVTDETYPGNLKYSLSFTIHDIVTSADSSVYQNGIDIALVFSENKKCKGDDGNFLRGVAINGKATSNGTFYGGLNLNYKVTSPNWKKVLETYGAPTDRNLSYCYFKNGEKLYPKKSTYTAECDAIFTMCDDYKNGLFCVDDSLMERLTKTEAEKLMREKIAEVTGGEGKTFATLSTELQNYTDSVVDDLKTELSDLGYLTTDTVDAAITNYFANDTHKQALINAVLADEGLDQKIVDKIYSTFGYNTSGKSADELEGYVKDKITSYVGDFIGTAQTPTNRISDVIKAVVTDDYINKAVSDLSTAIDEINDDIASIGADISNINTTLEYLSYLKGQFGTSNIAETLSYINNMRNQFGSSSVTDVLRRIAELEKKTETKPLDGKDGQSFTDWAIQNYQSVDNFINYVANLVAAKTKDGASAYEIAVKNGYKGSEKEWLETLKGKDAYQLAVELGFVGTEQQWLDSLRGEDGEDGEIIYVNGAYNNLPDSTIDDTDDDDVTVEEDDEEDDTEEDDETVEEDDEEAVEEDDEEDDEADYDDDDVSVDDEDSSDEDDDVEVIIPDKNDKDDKDDVAGDEIYIVDDKKDHTASTHSNNPATGVAIGIIIPLAGVGSVLLLKKDKRRRGRK